MARPHKERRVEMLPPVTHYKPAGIPMRDIAEVILTIEEMEAIRLADVELLEQAAAAERMEVSRPTFHRIITKAHQKIASALWQGNALRIEGGAFRLAKQCNERRRFRCRACDHDWTSQAEQVHADTCPKCQTEEDSDASKR